MFKTKHMYIRLIKKWGGHKEGDVIRFGRTKGEGRIAAGEGVEVKKPKAVNDPIPKTKPKVETAAVVPKVENAMLDVKASPDAKEKARDANRTGAELQYKKEAKAEEKAKSEDKKKGDGNERRK